MKTFPPSIRCSRRAGNKIISSAWTFFVLILGFAHGLAAWAQSTIHVPADQPTIQAGIDAAVNGDTVLVAPGTYAESLDFKGKNITVTSGAKTYADAAGVVLQQVGTQAIASFHSGESSSAVLNGFTFPNGLGNVISVTSSSPTISNNSLNNIAGCGVFINGTASGPTVKGNLFSNMQLQPLKYCGGAGWGSAVAAFQAGNLSIEANVIKGANETDVGSGGVTHLIDLELCASALIENNIIRNNTVQGSVVHTHIIGSLLVVQNAIYNNVFKNTSIGQGAFTSDSAVELTNNSLPVGYQQAGPTAVLNNTITNNNKVDSGNQTASQMFYGIINIPYIYPAASFENNLFINTKEGTAAQCGFAPGEPSTYGYNDSFNAGVLVPPTSCTSSGTATANINQDPQFLNLTGGDVRIAHTSPAVYAGDINAPSLPAADLAGKNRTVCGKIDMGAYQTHPHPPITLSPSPNPVAGGSVVTFTAQVTGNCNVPTGDVTFLDNGTTLGTGTLNSSAVATLSTSFLTVGTHHLTATYPGDFNFEDGTSNTVDLTVTGLPTTTTLSVSPNPAKAFQPITFTANVTDPFVPVTGTVTFTAGTTTLGTASLVNGIAAITSSQLGAGTYTVTATFNATTQFARSSASVQLQVDGAATTTALRSSLNPSLFGQAVTFGATVSFSGSAVAPQGTVTFRDGATILGTGSLDGTGATSFTSSQLTVGSHSITAAYGGSTNANASTSPVLLQIVNPVPTMVTLTGTPNPASVGQQVTLTASIAGTLGGAPSSGTVTFADQFGTIGTASVNAGNAVLSISTLASGTHPITATYIASGSFAGASSAPFTEVIQSFDFTITLSSPTLPIVSGASATLTAQIQGIGNVAGNVALAAANVPSPAAITFSPISVTFAGGASGSSVVSITTALRPHASLPSKPNPFGGSSSRILAAFAIVPFFFVKRRRIRAVCLTLTGLVSLASLSGCTNIYYPVSRLSPGTYIIPITGVDQTSKITHTVNLTINVTQ